MNGYLTTISVLLLLLAGAVIKWRRAEEALRRVDRMLSDGEKGRLPEADDLRSELERRLSRCLAVDGQSRQDARVQKEQVGALVSDIAQQTKPQLESLQACAQQLGTQPLTPEGRACLKALSNQTEGLQRFLDTLAETFRLETGLLSLHPQKDALDPVLTRAAARYAPKAWDKEVALTADKTDSRAVFDAKWTEEALCALLDNAVKYTPSGGRVTVAVEEEEAFCVVRVSDTGPGIPDRELDKIFQQFYRAPETRQEPGAGVGLCFAQQVARCQGGCVKAETVLGKGSTFSLYLSKE